MKAAKTIIRNNKIVNLYALNSKAIKKAMKDYMEVIAVKSINSGSSKGATIVVVPGNEAAKALMFFKNFGIVNCLGGDVALGRVSDQSREIVFDALYLSEEMKIEVYG